MDWDILRKSTWFKNIYPHITFIFDFFEAKLYLNRIVILGIPVMLLAASILYPYFKKKKYDGRFYVYFINTVLCFIGMLIAEISFLMRL
jgi:hypothetical protein